MDFQHFLEIGERLKLEGRDLRDLLRADRKARVEEADRQALAFREESDRQIQAEERRMHHEKAMASMHLESDRARAESLNATANDLNQSRAPFSAGLTMVRMVRPLQAPHN